MRCAGHGRGSVGGTLLGAGGAPEGPWRRRRVRTRTLELYLSILFLLVVVVVFVVVVFVVAFFLIVIFLLVVRVVVRQRIGLKEPSAGSHARLSLLPRARRVAGVFLFRWALRVPPGDAPSSSSSDELDLTSSGSSPQSGKAAATRSP